MITQINQKVSVIGLGPMGQAITKVFLENGYTTTVWNRTKSKAEALERLGAKHAQTVREALGASSIVIISLTDYHLMYQVLNEATDAIAGKVIVNLSSDTPEMSRKAAKWATDNNAKFIAGGIMADPPMVGKEGSFTLYSGEESVFNEHKPMLQTIGRADFLGNDVGLAMLFYQAQLDIFFASAAGVLHGLALIQSANIPATSFKQYLEETLSSLPYFFNGMAEEADSGKYNGELNNIHMMSASINHVAMASREAKVSTKLPSLISEMFEKTVASGFGEHGLTSLIEVLKKPENEYRYQRKIKNLNLKK